MQAKSMGFNRPGREFFLGRVGCTFGGTLALFFKFISLAKLFLLNVACYIESPPRPIEARIDSIRGRF